MNIIKIENYKSAIGFNDKVEIYVEKRKDLNRQGVVVILSEDDIENFNTIIKLKGYSIYLLIIPKKYRFTFNDTKYFKDLSHQFIPNVIISYY